MLIIRLRMISHIVISDGISCRHEPYVHTFLLFAFPSGRRTAYNWLTGSSVDTLADYTVGSESMSSLMVFDKKAERRMTSRRPVGEGFGVRRLTLSSDEVDSRTAGQFSGSTFEK